MIKVNLNLLVDLGIAAGWKARLKYTGIGHFELMGSQGRFSASFRYVFRTRNKREFEPPLWKSAAGGYEANLDIPGIVHSVHETQRKV